jgi:hypothetical protein
MPVKMPTQDKMRTEPLPYGLNSLQSANYFVLREFCCGSGFKKMLVWISTRSLRTRDEDTCNNVYSSKLLSCTMYKEERNNEMSF